MGGRVSELFGLWGSSLGFMASVGCFGVVGSRALRLEAFLGTMRSLGF